MKKSLLKFTMVFSMSMLIGLLSVYGQYFEKKYLEDLEKDKLIQVLNAENNKQEFDLSVKSTCSDIKEEVKNELSIYLLKDNILVFNTKGFPSSGYGWELAEIDNFMMKLIVEKNDPSKGFGNLENKRFVLKSIGKGTTSLKLVYRRAWENKAPAKEYLIKVNCEGAYTGDFKFVPEPIKKEEPVVEKESSSKALPSSFDWRDQGVVTSIKDQGQTGACWAFGACASFEAVIGIKTGSTVNLSEQWLCDCNNQYMDCQYGGWFPQYMFKSYGAVYESQNPFYGYNKYCYSYTYHERATSWGYTSGISDYAVPSFWHSATNNQIKQCILTYGPIATTTYCDGWSNYTGGIFNYHSSTAGHIVAIVGWNDAGGYWIIKNSWGSSWGENGFMRFAYNNSWMGRTSMWINMTGTTPTVCDLSIYLVAEQITETSVHLDWQPPASGGHSRWNLQYREAGTSTWTTRSSSTSYYSLSGLTAGTSYEWRVQTVCSSLSDWTATQSFSTTGGSSCNVPSGLQAGNLTENSVNISWNAVSGANNYDIEYHESGTSNWNDLYTTSTSISLTSLTASTNYELRLRANCSVGSSNFSGTISFTTLGGTTGLIAWDDFESGNSSGGAGWEANWSLPNGYASVSTTGAVYGDYNLRAIYNGYGDRKLDLSGYSNVTMEFDVKGYSFEGSDQGRVYFWNGSSWDRVYTLYNGQDNNSYSHKTVSLTNITGSTHYIRIEAACSYTSDYFYVDNIEIKASPAAPNASNEIITDLVIFPNPCPDDILNIKFPNGKGTLQIIDMNGRILLRKEITSSITTLNIKGIHPGVYNLNISSGNNVFNKRFVRE